MTCQPVIPGSIRSVITRSQVSPSKRFSPLGPSAAIPHSYPKYSRSAWIESRTIGSSSMSRMRRALVSGTGGTRCQRHARFVWHVSVRQAALPMVWPRKPSRKRRRVRPHRRPARSGRFPDRRIFARGNSLNPDSVPRLPPAFVSIAHGRTCVGQAYGLLVLADNNDHARGQGDSHGDLLRSYPPGRDRCQRPWAVDWTMRRGRPPFPRDGGPGRPVSSADHRARRAVDGSPPLHRRGTERRFMTRIARTRRLGTGRRRLA